MRLENGTGTMAAGAPFMAGAAGAGAAEAAAAAKAARMASAPRQAGEHVAPDGGLEQAGGGRGLVRDAKIYLVATAFCILFASVYEFFSHGVLSAWMIGMFAVPLLAGALPSFVLSRAARIGMPFGRRCERAASARKLWGSAVLAATLGCCFIGVLEIYGTTSPYVPVYWLAAAVLAIAAILKSR